MKARIILVLALLLVILSGTSMMASAEDVVVPFKASYSMHPQVLGVDPVTGCMIQKLPGDGEATHLGKSTWYSDARGCRATWLQYGTSIFTSANGDQLIGNFEGTFEFLQGGTIKCWGDFWITSGTGRFEGATGSGEYECTVWATTAVQEGVLDFDGTLTK